MRRKREGWNIVLAGFWNRMIFTQDWVAERVFHHQKLESYAILLPVLRVVFSDQSVSMEVSDARLLFHPKKLNNDADLALAESMAMEALKALPETPVQAVGVNFSYVEDFPPEFLTAVFNVNDSRDLATMGWAMTERKITRRLTQGGDTLNLTLTYEDKAVTFDLNYHTEVASNAAAMQTVKSGRVTALRRQGLDLLLGAYKLHMEEGGDDDNA